MGSKKKLKYVEETVKQNWNFQRGGWLNPEKKNLPWKGYSVWMFSGTP